MVLLTKNGGGQTNITALAMTGLFSDPQNYFYKFRRYQRKPTQYELKLFALVMDMRKCVSYKNQLINCVCLYIVKILEIF